MPQIDPETLDEVDRYHLLAGLVVPRPIAWVSTISSSGVRNLAPHSFYNIVSASPPIIHFTQTGAKDTLRNVRETKEFVVNVVSIDLLEEMNLTSADLPPGEDEFDWASLEGAPATMVAPPRVAAAKAALECRLHSIMEIGDGFLIFGDVVHIHVSDAVWREGRVDFDLLQPVGRLSGALYAPVDRTLRLPRPRWDPVERIIRG